MGFITTIEAVVVMDPVDGCRKLLRFEANPERRADPLTIYRSIAGGVGVGTRAGHWPRAAYASDIESHSSLILIHT